jgi:predicted translin family RNA/ssDNA-binding protein
LEDQLSDTHQTKSLFERVCREVTNISARSIAAIHRNDLDTANHLLTQAASRIVSLKAMIEWTPDFIQNDVYQRAQHKYATALCLRAFVLDSDLPPIQGSGLQPKTYVRGLIDTAEELVKMAVECLRNQCQVGFESHLRQVEAIHDAMAYSRLSRQDDAFQRHIELVREALDRITLCSTAV